MITFLLTDKMSKLYCQKCPKAYDTWRQLNRHYRDTHSEQKIKCPNADLGCTYEVTKSKRDRMRGHVESCRYDPRSGGPKPRSETRSPSKKQKSKPKPSHTVTREEHQLETPQYTAGSNGLPDILCNRPWSPVTITTRAPAVSSTTKDLFSPPRKVIRREDPLPSPPVAPSKSDTASTKVKKPLISMPADEPLTTSAGTDEPLPPPPTTESSSLNTPVLPPSGTPLPPLLSHGLGMTLNTESPLPAITLPPLLSPLTEDPRAQGTLSAAGDATTEAPPSKNPQKDGETISLRPYNALRQMDVGSARGTTYDYLVSDPRLFFLGAPSSYSESVQASFLRNVREAALHVPSRYAVKFWPPELSHIKKEESAVLPDGTIYKLGNFWFKKETTLCNASTQTPSPMDAPPTGTPSEDKATQVGMIMQWVIPEEPEK